MLVFIVQKVHHKEVWPHLQNILRKITDLKLPNILLGAKISLLIPSGDIWPVANGTSTEGEWQGNLFHFFIVKIG